MEPFLVGLVVIIIAILGYVVYIFIKKKVGCNCNLILSRLRNTLTSNRGNSNTNNSSSNNLTNIARSISRTLRPRRDVPRVIFDFGNDCHLARVGETVTFRILFPIVIDRSNPENLALLRQQLENSTLIRINLKLNSVSEAARLITLSRLNNGSSSNSSSNSLNSNSQNQTSIPFVSEFQEVNLNSDNLEQQQPSSLESQCQGEKQETFLVKFNVKISGLYEIYVSNANYQFQKTFSKFFNPQLVDSEKTMICKMSSTLIFVYGNKSDILIDAKDRFDNYCLASDVNFNEFSIAIKHVDESFEDNIVENFTYNFKWVQDENSRSKIILEIALYEFGIFHLSVYFKNSAIKNGILDIVCLTNDEESIFQNYLSSPNSSNYHVGKLLALKDEVQKKLKTVYIYLSPTVLSVKDYFFGIIPLRIATYRVLPATKMKLLFINHESGTSTFEIVDKTYQKVTIETETTTCRILMALFTYYLQNRFGGSESFENKRKFFNEELLKNKDLIEGRSSKLVLHIQREHLIPTTLSETRFLNANEWCKNFKILFVGEAGIDSGGLRREWLDLLCKKLFENNPNGLFCTTGASRLVLPNYKKDSNWNLKHYELCGKIIGKCIFETAVGGFYKQMVNGRFARSFLAQLIGFSPHFKHFEQDDPEIYNGKVKYILESSVTDLDLYFCDEEYSSNGKLLKTVELIPNGSTTKVTNDNKEEFLNALAQYRLSTRIKKEIESLLKGVHEIIPEGLLSNFDENELELLMCGRSEFKIEDLKANHVLTDEDDSSSNRKILNWFWNVVSSLSEDEKARFLQFTTGSSLLPYGGFKELLPKFRITIINDSFGHLPISHTCFSEICLSHHQTYEEFEKSFKLAINEGSEGFGLK